MTKFFQNRTQAYESPLSLQLHTAHYSITKVLRAKFWMFFLNNFHIRSSKSLTFTARDNRQASYLSYFYANLWAASWQKPLSSKPTKWQDSDPGFISAWVSAQLDNNIRCVFQWLLWYVHSQAFASDCANAQADLSLCWAHIPLWWLFHELALISLIRFIDTNFIPNILKRYSQFSKRKNSSNLWLGSLSFFHIMSHMWWTGGHI